MRVSSFLFLAALGLALLPGCNSPDITPVVLRVMTYNIHHAEGLDGKVDLERIANVIRQSNADIVALQEVDKNTERTGGIDMPADLASRTGMNVVFAANLDNFQGGQYGTAILSRFPIESHENHLLKQSRQGEQRGVLQAVLAVNQGQLLFACTHLDHKSDSAERLFSETQFANLFAGYNALPALLCGDFNDTPNSELHKRLSKKWADAWSVSGKGNGYTMSSDNPKRRIDYIWLSSKKNFKVRWLDVPKTEASDHLPLVAEIRFTPAPRPMGTPEIMLLIIVMTLLSAIPIGIAATIIISSRRNRKQA
ncbi:MAG: endonuclease/exonuclease/phosphatase family metal-dependent hydrolase [Limisphaerales bacterium]|jgi:endonuclease/exonuclease/phosphatase family metal-dependent hydrolase